MRKSTILMLAIPASVLLVVIGMIIGQELARSSLSPPPQTIPPGSRLLIRPTPLPGPTEAKPTLTLRCQVRDAVTGDLVVADEVRLGDHVVHRRVAVFDVTVPGRLTGDYLYLTIVATGYQPWTVGLRHNLDHSRTLPLTINLIRTPGL